MTVAVTYWEVNKTPDGSPQAWHGEITFNKADAPEWIQPYLEQRVMHVPENVFRNKDFDAYGYYMALHPDHHLKRRIGNGS